MEEVSVVGGCGTAGCVKNRKSKRMSENGLILGLEEVSVKKGIIP